MLGLLYFAVTELLVAEVFVHGDAGVVLVVDLAGSIFSFRSVHIANKIIL